MCLPGRRRLVMLGSVACVCSLGPARGLLPAPAPRPWRSRGRVVKVAALGVRCLHAAVGSAYHCRGLAGRVLQLWAVGLAVVAVGAVRFEVSAGPPCSVVGAGRLGRRPLARPPSVGGSGVRGSCTGCREYVV